MAACPWDKPWGSLGMLMAALAIDRLGPAE
jgi:hypothetical protein